MTQKIPRLKDFINKITNRKYRNGFINYLKVSSFDEYYQMQKLYGDIIFKLIFKYDNSKFLSKNWFKYMYLKLLWSKIYEIFSRGNNSFMIKINKELGESNKKRRKLLDEINEYKNILKSLNTISLNLSDTSNKNIIKINLTIIDLIYSDNYLNKLYDELNKKIN